MQLRRHFRIPYHPVTRLLITSLLAVALAIGVFTGASLFSPQKVLAASCSGRSYATSGGGVILFAAHPSCDTTEQKIEVDFYVQWFNGNDWTTVYTVQKSCSLCSRADFPALDSYDFKAPYKGRYRVQISEEYTGTDREMFGTNWYSPILYI